MSIPAAWPQVLDFIGKSARRRAVGAPGLGRHQAAPHPPVRPGIGLTRAYTEAVDDPRATGFTEPGLSERARARVGGILAGCPDRDGHGNRLDS